MAKIYEQEGSIANVNIIAAGTTLTGDIITSGDCRIDGTIRGNIKSESKIIVGKTGLIEGEISCKSIEIEGNVKANINVQEQINMRATAVLTGNISVGKISIEPGASFTGSCKMNNNKEKTADSPASTPAKNG